MSIERSQPFAVSGQGALYVPCGPNVYYLTPMQHDGLDVTRLTWLPLIPGRCYNLVACAPALHTVLIADGYEGVAISYRNSDGTCESLSCGGIFDEIVSVTYARGVYWLAVHTDVQGTVGLYNYDPEDGELTESHLLDVLESQGVNLRWYPVILGQQSTLAILAGQSELIVVGEDFRVLRRHDLKEGSLLGLSAEGVAVMHPSARETLVLGHISAAGGWEFSTELASPPRKMSGFCVLADGRIVAEACDGTDNCPVLLWDARTAEWGAVRIDEVSVELEALLQDVAADLASGEVADDRPPPCRGESS